MKKAWLTAVTAFAVATCISVLAPARALAADDANDARLARIAEVREEIQKIALAYNPDLSQAALETFVGKFETAVLTHLRGVIEAAEKNIAAPDVSSVAVVFEKSIKPGLEEQNLGSSDLTRLQELVVEWASLEAAPRVGRVAPESSARQR